MTTATFRESSFVWSNGEIVSSGRAGLGRRSVLSEEIRCFATARGAAVFQAGEHVDRLLAAAEARGIVIPFSRGELAAAVCQTVAANELPGCRVRIVVFRGGSPYADVAVTAQAWDGEREQQELAFAHRDLHFVDECTFAGAASVVPYV